MVTVDVMKRYRKHLIWFGVSGTIILLVLLTLPYALLYGLVRWVEQRGGENVRIENVDYNPFTGELSVFNFRVRDPDGTAGRIGRLSLNLRNMALWHKRIHFSSVEIEDSFFDIFQLRDITELVTGVPQPSANAQPKKPSKWKVGFDGFVIHQMEVVFHPKGGAERIFVERGRMSRLALWIAQQPTRVDTTLRVSGGTMRISGQFRPLTVKPAVNLRVKATSVRLDPILQIMAIPRLTTLSGQIESDLAVRSSATDGTRWAVEVKGSLRARDVHSTLGEATMKNDHFSWDGRLSLDLPTGGGFALAADGTFKSGKLALALPVAGLRVAQRAANWRGKLQYGPGENENRNLAMQAVAELSGVSVVSDELQVRLLEFDSLAFKGLVVETGQKLRSDQIFVQKITAMRPIEGSINSDNLPTSPSSVLQLDAIVVESFATVGRSRWTAQKVTLDNTSAELERLKNGEFRLLGSVLAFVTRLTDNKTTEKNKTTTFAVQEWLVGSGSRLTITDRSVDPPVRIAFTPVTARLEGIDSAEPNRAIPLELQARIGKYTTLEMKGTSNPFTERLNLDVKGTLAGFELETVSAYARHNLGYDLTGGRLDADFNAKIIEGRLQSESQLTISKLRVAPTNPQLLDPLKKRLQVPLETALSLLRDSEDVIRLQIPVTGDLTSPKFDFSGAVNQAIGSAMKKAVLTTAKLVFPLGGVIMAMSDLGDRLRLEPLRFDPGSATLNSVAQTYLRDVDKLLKERPTVKLSICGRVTEGDRGVLQNQSQTKAAVGGQSQAPKPTAADPSADKPLQPVEAAAGRDELLKLARKRAETVKDYMIKSFGIEESRLFLCPPAFDQEPKGIPRVEIVL